jgi:hypothetical protein
MAGCHADVGARADASCHLHHYLSAGGLWFAGAAGKPSTGGKNGQSILRGLMVVIAALLLFEQIH